MENSANATASCPVGAVRAEVDEDVEIMRNSSIFVGESSDWKAIWRKKMKQRRRSPFYFKYTLNCVSKTITTVIPPLLSIAVWSKFRNFCTLRVANLLVSRILLTCIWPHHRIESCSQDGSCWQWGRQRAQRWGHNIVLVRCHKHWPNLPRHHKHPGRQRR